MKSTLVKKPFKKALKVLFITTEAAPFSKVGGLGEVLWALPRAMRQLGCDARVFVPRYGSMETNSLSLKKEVINLKVVPKEQDPQGLLVCNILQHTADDYGVTYFLENKECFEKRANAYGYADDTMRFVLISRAAVEFVRQSAWKPDFIIANDWMTGFVPNLIKTEYKKDSDLQSIGIIFCIHNLRNQGTFDAAYVSELETDSGQGPLPEFFSDMTHLNGMRRGILYADSIVTVSPTYAKEILLPEYGEGLEEVLQERQADIWGILNGIDMESFDPSTDDSIPTRYSTQHLNMKVKNKSELQRRFNLTIDENAMIIGFNGRLDEQKGLSLLEEILRPLLDNLSFQFVAIGTGDVRFKKFFKELEKAYPHRVGVHLEYDGTLPRLMYAGADAVLVPSRFEPSGLVQMEAMRYGAVPIVRKTGGLADTVDDFDPKTSRGTGFVFEKFDSHALLIAIVRAHEIYQNKREWMGIVKRGMNEDFSWKSSARKYIGLCRKLQKLPQEESVSQ
ncbi:MAG: glycogen/starch synthase [bacterium]|nr:glycogen/starch synthase [bacterium]